MLQRNSDYNRIKFTEPEKVTKEPVEKVAEETTKPIDSTVYRSDNNRGMESRGGRSILSAGQGSITDKGGPKKYEGSSTNNSIWDNNILQKLSESKDSGESIKETQAKIIDHRQSMREERMNNIVDSLQKTDTRKANSVSDVTSPEHAGSSYKAPKHNISIFDDVADFTRVPEKTAGEMASEESNKSKEKDESWKDIKKPESTRSMFDNLFDNITRNEKN